jgi:hypothetical protein
MRGMAVVAVFLAAGGVEDGDGKGEDDDGNDEIRGSDVHRAGSLFLE